MRNAAVNVIVVAVLAAMLAVGTLSGGVEAAECNAGKLRPCIPAIMNKEKPTMACCANLKAQQGCFCQFAKQPAYSRYINSPNSRKAVAACGLAVPHC